MRWTLTLLVLAGCARTEMLDDAERFDLRFTSGVVDGLTFTRASPAFVTGADGFLRRVAVDEPRFDFDFDSGRALGLHVEPAAMNWLVNSNDFTQASWRIIGVTLETVANAGPTGETAFYVRETDEPGPHNHRFRQTVPADLPEGVYTLSCYVRAAERNFMSLKMLTRDGALPSGFFDLSRAVVTNGEEWNARIDAAAAGWYRVAISFAFPAGESVPMVELNVRDATNDFLYAGDRNSGLYIWACQLEAGSAVSSLVETGNTPATRAADVASIDFGVAGERGVLAANFTLGEVTGDTAWVVASGDVGLAAFDKASGAYGVWRGQLDAATSTTLAASREAKAATAWTQSRVSTVLDDGRMASASGGLSVGALQIGTAPQGASGTTSLWIQRLRFIDGRPDDDAVRALTR